jgi:predicted GIY-YIG superfamily endonuclease
MNAAYFVYILASGRNGTLYIGVTRRRAWKIELIEAQPGLA